VHDHDTPVDFTGQYFPGAHAQGPMHAEVLTRKVAEPSLKTPMGQTRCTSSSSLLALQYIPTGHRLQAVPPGDGTLACPRITPFPIGAHTPLNMLLRLSQNQLETPTRAGAVCTHACGRSGLHVPTGQ
jgi:hypothetical protein